MLPAGEGITRDVQSLRELGYQSDVRLQVVVVVTWQTDNRSLHFHMHASPARIHINKCHTAPGSTNTEEICLAFS